MRGTGSTKRASVETLVNRVELCLTLRSGFVGTVLAQDRKDDIARLSGHSTHCYPVRLTPCPKILVVGLELWIRPGRNKGGAPDGPAQIG